MGVTRWYWVSAKLMVRDLNACTIQPLTSPFKTESDICCHFKHLRSVPGGGGNPLLNQIRQLSEAGYHVEVRLIQPIINPIGDLPSVHRSIWTISFCKKIIINQIMDQTGCMKPSPIQLHPHPKAVTHMAHFLHQKIHGNPVRCRKCCTREQLQYFYQMTLVNATQQAQTSKRCFRHTRANHTLMDR